MEISATDGRFTKCQFGPQESYFLFKIYQFVLRNCNLQMAVNRIVEKFLWEYGHYFSIVLRITIIVTAGMFLK